MLLGRLVFFWGGLQKKANDVDFHKALIVLSNPNPSFLIFP